MKKLLAFSLLTSLVITSCKDKNDPTPPTPVSNFQPMTANSSWTYKFEDKNNAANNFNFTVKATSKDTSISSKTYKVFTNTSASNEYYYHSGSDYSTFAGFAGLTNSIELTYLKDAAVGTNWTETKNVIVSGITLPATFNYEIREKLATLALNGLNFTNVLKVHVTLAVTGVTISSQDLNFYYADGVGRVKTELKLVIPFPVVNTNTESSITAYTIAP